jgi:hypothetical protein
LHELRRVQAHLRSELRDVVSEFDNRPLDDLPSPVLPPPDRNDGERDDRST